MGIPTFDAWAASRVTKSMPISSLSHSVIGIDAAYYLEGFAKEPLLSALGGFPLALASTIIKELSDLQSVGLKVHFVFNGLDQGFNDDPFGASLAAANINAQAFEEYDMAKAQTAIAIFKSSGNPTSAALSEWLKKLLYTNNIPFTVAPYSAIAQLAYFKKHPSQFIDAVLGPSETFLYGVDKIITRFKFTYQANDSITRGHPRRTSQFLPESSEVFWVDQGTCLEELGRIPSDLFVDALLLAGSKTLCAFPPLPKSCSLRETVNLIAGSGPNIITLCEQYPDDENIKRLDYVDRYKRAVAGVRHHVVITMEGDIEPLDKENAPSDIHDCVGQRLPEELNMYLSRGLVRSRVLNWLASGTILMPAPDAGGDSDVYQDLMRMQLEPLRKQSLSLIADSLNRYYQRKEITTKYWFDMTEGATINIKDLLPSPKDTIASWNMSEEDMLHGNRVFDGATNLPLGSMAFAIRSLQDESFAARTITPRSKDSHRVRDLLRGEVCANALWRFLQLRGYIDQQHRLTTWGKVLDGMLLISGSNVQGEKAVFLAVELLRLGLLNANTMFERYPGAPVRGSEIDKRNCMLVSRVACLGRLQHQPRGYSGPLSRHLLAYQSTISAVQASMRDLIEMVLATMFLEGCVNRERDDWMDLALQLPFFDEESCALGILMLTYLDQLHERDDPTSEATREEMKIHGREWVIHSEFDINYQHALQLWDAVYHGVNLAKSAGEKVNDFEMWAEVNQWLSERR
ncbi:MAG: hypothetical protein Q9220_005351 [cf. Caloplaca sp. 1 TL-2023]